MALPSLNTGDLVTESIWNAHVTQINTNSSDIELNTSTLVDHNNSLAGHESRIDDLETQKHSGSYVGQWSDNSGGSGIYIDSGAGEKITDITTPMGTPVGCSLTNGVFTAAQGGLWMFTLSIQTTGGDGNTGTRALFLWKGDAAIWPETGTRYGLTASGPEATALTTAAVIRLNAGEKLTCMAANWTTGGSTRLWRAGGNVLSATWLAP